MDSLDIAETFKLPYKDKDRWDLKKARIILQGSSDLNKYIHQITYRPFDCRWIYYHDFLVARRVYDVMRHMMKGNLGLCVGRAGQVVGLEKPWNIVFCSEYMVDLNLFYRGGNVNFPLYLYSNQKTKKQNLNQELIKSLPEAYGKGVTTEEIFYYIYAVLYSNTYRTKYAEFLKIDFPRVPFTKDYKLFIRMDEMGKRLVDLHMMKSDELNNPIAKFQGIGENRVEKRRYEEGVARVYINKTQYFEGIEKEVWEYQMGGYQVLDKWLKDRKGRELSLEDIKHYCKVVTAIRKTIEVQKAIDQIYPGIEEEVIEFSNQKARTESLVDII